MNVMREVISAVLMLDVTTLWEVIHAPVILDTLEVDATAKVYTILKLCKKDNIYGYVRVYGCSSVLLELKHYSKATV